eukprot:Amastigsp_a339259_1001.p1 type:complete len:204 gc:universal Amastigsp_a339259_1001:1407-796(-)
MAEHRAIAVATSAPENTMRHRSIGEIEGALRSDVLLDEDEQELLCATLKEENQRLNRLYRWVLAGISLLFALVFLYLGLHEIVYPFMVSTHAFIAPATSSGTIATLELFGALGLGAAALFIEPHGESLKTVFAGASVAASLVPLVSWLWIFTLSFDAFPVHLLWLPCAPMGMALLSLYVKSGCDDIEREAAELKNYIYRYKSV